MDPTLEMAGQLGLSALLGGLIGLEREMHGQAAGLRTHMVLSLGACLVMLVSIFLWESHSPAQGDPGRIAAHVVAGIGFLGAGAIMRFGTTVKGLTTAACLWTAAGIGLAVGAGYWQAALVATGLTLVAIFVFDKIENTLLSGREYRRFVVHAREAEGLSGRVQGLLKEAGIRVRKIEIRRDLTEKRIRLVYLSAWPDHVDPDAVTARAGGEAGVERVELD